MLNTQGTEWLRQRCNKRFCKRYAGACVDYRGAEAATTVPKTTASSQLPLQHLRRCICCRTRLQVHHQVSLVIYIQACQRIHRTGIFLLNPCHVTTVLQLILLKLPDSPWTTQIFRFHMYTMPGAVVALLFPILNTRLVGVRKASHHNRKV